MRDHRFEISELKPCETIDKEIEEEQIEKRE